MSRFARLLRLSPARIGASYLVFGGLWILVSDRVVVAVAQTPEAAAQLQTIKGWVFVGLSGLLIVGLTRTLEHQLESTQSRLLTASQELQVLHRIFRHNIRNDLNVVQGYATLAREEVADATIREYLDTISRTAAQLVTMSDKINVIERTELRTEVDDVVDLAALVREERDRLLDRHPAVSVEAALPEQARIHGDHSLTYVIRELLENAVEHFPGPTERCVVRIDLDHAVTGVTLRIADNGSGIPDGELVAVREGQESPLYHASSVGLWLVTWLTRLADGSVRFDGGGDDGTVITLEFHAASPVDAFTERALSGTPLAAGA